MVGWRLGAPVQFIRRLEWEDRLVPNNDDSSGELAWERQAGESEPAFMAFAAYRDQSTPRSLAKLSKELEKSRQLLERWSSRHGWVSRVAAFDMDRDRRRREARRREDEELVGRQASHLAEAAEMLMKPVEALLQRLTAAHDEGEDPYGDMSLLQLWRLVRWSIAAMPRIVAAERLVSGIGAEGHVDPEYARYVEARAKVEAMTRQEQEALLLGLTA
jgi:hypothetical protein